MPTDYLPGYRWDGRLHRYVNVASGRFVGRQAILDLLDAEIAQREREMGRLLMAFMNGELVPGVWLHEMQTALRRTHLQMAALGAGGWERLTPADYGRIGGYLAADYRRLAEFARALEAGELTPAQALARMGLYLGNARRNFWHGQEPTPGVAGRVVLFRRELGMAEHCDDCVGYAGLGWQRADSGLAPAPGEGSVCLTNCRCTRRRVEVPAADVEQWIGSQRAG